ncbi:MAG: FAD-binding oxidoreductase, partial [Planctomycetes bacterium]|nr:FAD-binding oxidoreductase [Planctomycetota bacterium]
LRIRRVDHPLGRITAEDTAVFAVEDESGGELRRIPVPGVELRRKGLGKDITNKALRGLPGLQKEGTDGVITGAEFVLHRAYPLSRTFCLEFYGASMDEAGEVIQALAREFSDQGGEVLTALEHFDEQYVKAIGYRNKAPRTAIPKAVLLIDLNGHDGEEIERGSERLRALLAPYQSTCLFQATDSAEAARFWADRKRMGAIARRTNAFKLNEDIVLPLAELVPFTRRVEALNQAEERINQLESVSALLAVVEAGEAALASKREQARRFAAEAVSAIEAADAASLGEGLLSGRFAEELEGLYAGYAEPLAALTKTRRLWRSRIVVVATHMHAGDGNVHVNIPVFSNDRWMMRRAVLAAEEMMCWAVEHGGVVSGEHGIGITKFHHLGADRIKELADWRDEIDPRRLINPGKLEDATILDCVFTPSFNLLELEARILQHGSLEDLAEKISGCIRCGRCKPDCCVFSPAQGLFYHPRNKNLALGALIESILYDVQRRHSACFEPLRWLRQIADHCTIYHKCLKPCPVEIDTGVVTVFERAVLAAHKVERKPLATRMTLAYLESRSPVWNRVFRGGLLRLGGAGQRAASALARALLPVDSRVWKNYPLPLLRSPLRPPSEGELFDLLPACGPNQCLVLHPASPLTTVFYFPGCGSERLFSEVGKASLWLLGQVGASVVLPPPHLCCGYPHYANSSPAAGRIELRDAVIFGQIQRMMSHLSFDAGVASCGTCLESLRHLGAPEIFSAAFQDICAFVLARGLSAAAGPACFYHAPCHDSLAGEGVRVLKALGR